jgi:hypothetical protein
MRLTTNTAIRRTPGATAGLPAVRYALPIFLTILAEQLVEGWST